MCLAKGGFAFVRRIFEHIPDGLVIPVLLARPRPNTGLVQTATDLIDGAAVLSHPGVDLLYNTGFVKNDLIARFSTAFLLAHVAVAVGSVAEDTHVPFLCGMPFASATAFKKFRSLVFGNHALHL